ncbi:hypothetical protein HPP92_017491 [Vanilla planifolia]|uniref:GAT domain-containing protein n=1 Tax=Vanilla planifolia TaxID=51239 RepID=A0A835QB76_VANPL|nr:hypothetical protein HPP92_017491 [Vanilla planifolia]
MTGDEHSTQSVCFENHSTGDLRDHVSTAPKDAALIYTPVSHNLPPQIGHAIPSSSIQRQDEVMNSEMGNLSLSDLKNIRSVTELFIDMLMAVNPESRQAVNDEIIVDLANQCRMNQKKVMHLISSTENEELLGEALVLNDNLQYALARHDAIASGSPLPLEPPHASLSTSSVVTPTLTHQQLDDQEVEEDDGNRDAKLKSTGDHLASSNQSDLNTATSPSGASEASSSVASNALVLLDPPTPGSASRKEDDMIDFLGLVLSTNPPPQTPPASVPPSNHSQNPFSDAPNPQQQVSSSQPVMVNQGYAANNSYVAPWAQPAVAPLPAPPPSIPPQQPVGQYPYNYQASPWNPSPGVSSNPFLPNSSVQFPAFPSPPPPPPPPPARPFQYPIYQSSTSASVASIKSPPPPVPEPIQYSKAIQNYNPLGSGQAQWNANNSNQTGSSSSSTTKSYFMPDKLFEDLIELRNPDGTLKSRNASTLLGPSGQGMARERK